MVFNLLGNENYLGVSHLPHACKMKETIHGPNYTTISCGTSLIAPCSLGRHENYEQNWFFS